ncbi:hypothetical protein [Pseudoxanthomonas sp. CF125]|uniref:hypothetical protein n=1 Tax=Pseudoxanthomonas sp. CF125 TaxID=1855303 RepID=UPI00087FEBB2|nr:hypothetical protein [Pseudoxanthomonas sp. CF125]SDQ63524.1 hypothetical protein SAMN05216569_1904 [Pseudoxanthomonas sp. CF125]
MIMTTKQSSVKMIVRAFLLLAATAPALSAWSAEAPGPQAPNCGPDACRKGDGLIFRIHSHGETQPARAGDDESALQASRRVQIAAVQDNRGTSGVGEEGRAVISAETSIELPQGGLVWATEDPALALPVLNVQGASMIAFEQGRIAGPVRFHAYSNYPAFIERLEVLIYRGGDTDLVTPLATVPVPVGIVGTAEWDGALPAGINLRLGDELLYVARAYGAEGAFDETHAQRLRLVSPADLARSASSAQDQAQRTLGVALDADSAQSRQISNAVYGRNALRMQNIALHGSRIRLQGQDIAAGTRLSINGQNIPVDQEGKFAAEFLEPVGIHRYLVTVTSDNAVVERSIELNVTGRYTYLVAMADLTLSKNEVSGNVEPLAGDENYEDGFLSEGRLAFYLKGKVRGRFLLTAHADTRERDIEHLFDGFLDADPQDIFRRLDPDLYYPVYGDDSNTYRDVDTQGKLYVRVDWDQSQALWGNFATGFTGTEYGQYNRSLYGAALNWRSRPATALGEPRSLLKAFASEAQTALGHSEFLGTGGSLYYLRHTDVLRGSEQVVLEVRDRTTGRTEARVNLRQGVDYEIDALQGRLLLTRPLAQLTRENVRTLSRDTPLDGYEQLLIADYEYVPVGFDADDVSMGLRGRHWFGEHLALGATYVDENRSGDDYLLRGADLTLQAGRGTYLKVEASRSEATVAPLFYSDNGGLSFIQRNAATGARSGDARAVEARANLKELGWTKQDWTVATWWRRVDAGFSVSRFDTGTGTEEYGAEFVGYFTDNLSLFGRYTYAERGDASLEQTQLTTDWRIGSDGRLGAELRHVDERTAAGSAVGMLAAVSYRHQVTEMLELYGVGQYTIDDDDGRYARNNLATAGARYLFGDRSSVGAEISSGSRGHGGKLDLETRVGPDHTAYGAYSYSTDTTSREPLFDRGLQTGWTLGQRWRLNNQTNVYNESQYLKDTSSESAGLAHTFGLDFMPSPGWNLGLTVMDGDLDSSSGHVDRRAYSVSGGRTDPRTQWSSKLEYRKDSGAEQREQWVTTNRLLFKINDDWRIAARANYADTQDDLNPAASAKLAEANVGFAWRPHDNTRWSAFGKYTYLYDVASLGQEGGNRYDQRSQILSFEGIAQLDDRWEMAGKVASRRGDYRAGRGTGRWLKSDVEFAAIQVRYHLIAKWEALAEYRWLGVTDGGDKRGWLVGVDRQIGDNFKIGVGFNFTEFNDDLTDLEYDNRGWFLNLSGYY